MTLVGNECMTENIDMVHYDEIGATTSERIAIKGDVYTLYQLHSLPMPYVPRSGFFGNQFSWQ